MKSLATFGESFYPGWAAAKFHRLLAKKLMKCLRRGIRRLIINVPPQHGKSRLASIIFAAWALTLHPTLRIMQAGHTATLSTGFSREARVLVQSERYKQFFPELINPRVNREDYWQTRLGGHYFATSVGGGTGMPADILLIDDPHKDRAEANSKTQRDKVWDWFTSTAMPRLAPDGIVIVIQTRWHKDDLAGRLQDPKRVAALKEAGFEDMNFEVLSLEALCENPTKDEMGRQIGEALWPEVRDTKWLMAQKLQIGSYEWNALYQQRPNPPGGAITDIKKIVGITFDKVPTNREMVRGWDLAVSKNNLGDYSAGARGCMDKEGNFYLVHMDRARRLWPEQQATIFKYIERESMGKRVGIEAVGAWETAAIAIRERYKGRVIVTSYSPTTDKLVRALPWIAKIDGGKFFMVEGAWNQDFLDELEQFPNGENDDQIDAVTVLWEMIAGSKKLVLA
jgi:predicted phage terminase large subunit-like protein